MNTTETKLKMPANFGEFESMMEELFGKKAPAMPDKVKEIIVKYSPYFILVVMVLSLPVLLAGLGISIVAIPLAGVSAGLGITGIVAVITMVMTLLALPGLFKRQMSGWKMLFYSSLVSALGSVLRLDLLGLILGTALSFWILFQVKSYYK